MKLVFSSTDRPLIESLRIALEAEGIPVVLDQDSSTALSFIAVNMFVSEANFDRARAVISELV